MIGLTSLWTNGRPIVSPELNRRRALIVLDKIDEILAWDKTCGVTGDVEQRFSGRDAVVLQRADQARQLPQARNDCAGGCDLLDRGCNKGRQAPNGCAPGQRDDQQYTEPTPTRNPDVSCRRRS